MPQKEPEAPPPDSRSIHADRLQVAVGRVNARETWRFTAEGRWYDSWIECGPKGYRNFLADILDIRPRAEAQRWFCLMGAVASDAPDGRLEILRDSTFRIGTGVVHTFDHSGMLVVFANDLLEKYSNNSGSVTLWSERVSQPGAHG